MYIPTTLPLQHTSASMVHLLSPMPMKRRAVSLSNLTATLSEDTDTTAAIKVADITLSDDGLGTNNLTLAGADAAMFSIVGSELFLNAGASLDFETNASLDVRVEVDDPGLPATPEDSAAMSISIIDANEAPLLSEANDLTAIDEDPVSNPGTLVSDLIAGQISDPDSGALTGIAVVAIDNTNGTWQYTVNGGGVWTDFGTPSTSAARLLAADANTYVRFVPNAYWNGTVTNGITFHAWDQTSGTTGTKVDATTTGGSTAFSTATDTASITVTAVNDAPVLGAIGNQTVDELATLTFTATATDADLPADTLTFSLDAASITLGMSIDANTGDFSWTPTEAQGGTTPSVTITVTDNGSGNLIDSETFIITVNPVNDAPTTLQATTTSNGGLSLNEDGGNDAYLIADDGIGSSSLSQISYELQFNASDLTSRLAFVSYYNSGDELSVVTEPTGELKIAVGNKLVTSSAINYESLRDGQNHTFTLTWDNAAGDWQVFIDGIIADSGTGLAVGQTIDPGGTLIIGQEQDAEGGGFATPQRLSATLYDARFFDVVRTQEEILANYNSTLPYDEPNQIANWTFNNLSSDSVVIDTVTGNNLTVQHVSDPAFTASTPELTLAVDENAATGTVVGTISGSDADREALIASLLAADPDLVYSATTGKFYKAVNTLTYWSTAQTSAEGTVLAGVNGQLVIIRSAAENEIVWNLAKPIGDSVYIGASDQTTEGSWYWQSGGSDADQFWSGAITGTNIDGSYTNWNVTQPNDLGGAEDVARLDSGDGLWYDTTITGPNQHYYAVEWDADTVLDSTQSLTYSIVSQTVPDAFTIVADSGKITVADGSLLDYETATSHSVEIQVTDSGGLSYNETFTISIADVNNAPTAANNTVTTNEDTTYTFTAADFNFNDIDGDTLASVKITSLEAVGSLQLSGVDVTLNQVISMADIDTGNLKFVPVPDANCAGYDSFGFSVNDGTMDSLSSYTMTIDVTAVDDDAVITGDVSYTGNEGDAVSGDMNATDVDGLTDTTYFTISAQGSNGTAAIDVETGAWTFTPTDPNWFGSDAFTVTVTDDLGGTTTQVVSIMLANVNDAPVLGAIGNQTVDELATLTFTATATDADLPADTLTYSLDAASIALGMSIDANTGVFTWTPTESQGGITPSVTVTVTDNGTGNLVDSETFTITVNDVNVAPVLGAIGNQTVDELATLTFTATATDADLPADTLTFSLDAASIALGMTIDANTGVFSWTPTEGQGGMTPSVTVTVTDNGTGNLVDSETFIITVSDINVAPVLGAIGNQTVDELATLTIIATATDADLPADTLTFSLDAASIALGMTIDANTGVFSWTPTEAQTGGHSVTITVTDNGTGNLIDSETFTITVNDINTAPVLGAIGDQTVDELATLTFTATATDSDLPADTLTFSLDAASIALGMTIDANTGVFSWTPTEGQGGTTPSVTITVTDSGTGNLVDSEIFTITVNDINVAPVLGAIGNQTVDELATLTFTATATDADLPADTLTFSLDAASIALGMTIDANTGVFSWTPTEAQTGGHPASPLQLRMMAPVTWSITKPSTITVNGTNTAPVLSAIGNQTVDELATLSFTATAIDADVPADTLTFSLDAASIALGMTIDANTGVFSWTPTEAQGGLTPSVTITVTDSGTGNLTDSEAFTLTVNDINVAPVLGAIGNQTVDELATLTFTATATDADLPTDTLTYTLDAASIALGMSIDANTGVFSWTPTEAQGGLTPSVTVTVTDSGSGNLVDSETFTITVNNINTAPVLGAIGNQTVNELATLSFTATATDADLPADTLTYSLDAASIALGMTIDANTGVFTWTPTESQGGITPSVTVTVTDNGTGNPVDSETFTITVNDVNVAPVLGAIGNQTVDELATLTFTATATDADLPADTLTFSLDAASIALGMSIDANTGVFTWIPTEAQGGMTPSVTVTVTDSGSGNLVDSEAFTITVNDINVAPVLGAIGNQTVDELATLTFTATATDSDLPADTLTFSLDAASVALGMSIDANTGVFSWTPTESQGGLTPSVTVTVTDNGTGNLVDSETFTITVNEINVAPVLGAIGNQTVDELSTLSFTATATDADLPADTLTYSLDAASIALGMSIDANTGAFTWTPTESQGGITPSVTVTVTDNGNGNLVDSETFTITVNDVNVAPVLGAIGNQTVDELATLTFTATATDADLPADTLTYSLDAASIALGMNIDANTGVFTWTPTEGQGGMTPSVTITVTDNGTGNLVDSEIFTITVNDINVDPVLGAIGNQTVNELATLTFTATATDADLPADTLTFSLDAASIALGMTIDANTGVFSWTPTEGQGGLTPSVTVTVTDNGTGNLVDSETFTITVNEINVAPAINNATFALDENTTNGTAVGNVPVTDPDTGDTHVYSITAGNTGGAFAVDNAGNITVANSTALNFETTPVFTLTVQAQDQGGTGLIDTATITVNLNDLNEAPTTTGIANVSVGEDAPNTVIDLFAAFADTEDADASLTYTITANTNPGLFAATPIDGVAGTLILDYAPNAYGTANITVRATDTSALWVESTFTVTVNPVNDAPATTPVTLTAIGEDGGGRLITQAELLANATDVDGPALTATNLDHQRRLRHPGRQRRRHLGLYPGCKRRHLGQLHLHRHRRQPDSHRQCDPRHYPGQRRAGHQQ